MLCLSATDVVIIYLSSGVTSRESSEQEKRATLSVVREENRHLNNSVMILTYALMNGSSPPRLHLPRLPHTLGAFDERLNIKIPMVHDVGPVLVQFFARLLKKLISIAALGQRGAQKPQRFSLLSLSIYLHL